MDGGGGQGCGGEEYMRARFEFGKIAIMVPQSLQIAADECFLQATSYIRTPEEHRASIELWNGILDQAAATASAAKVRLIDEKRYEEAAFARDMAEYLKAMKATLDAPFTGSND